MEDEQESPSDDLEAVDEEEDALGDGARTGRPYADGQTFLCLPIQ